METVRARARHLVAALAAIGLVLVLPAAASADVFTVNTTLDGGDNVCQGIAAGDCTLRDAVNDAAAGDTINVPAGTYVLSAQLGGELVLDANMTINGAGARSTVISGNNAVRVMRVSGATVGISGVTLTQGLDPQTTFTGGGAVHVSAGSTLAMADSAVTNSRSAFGGAGIYTNGNVQLSRVTVSGNQVNGTPGQGGGILHTSNNDPIRILAISDSTISGNSANGNGGGIYSAGSVVGLARTTIANNTAANGAGIYKNLTPTSAATQINDTIISAATGAACAGLVSAFSGTNNLASDTTCGVAPGTNPLIGPLLNNGGPTDTHALAPTSPAVNAANPANCTGTDQRGIARPQGGACDIGAYEYRAPTLTVSTSVVNDQGGTAEAAEFSVHVRAGGVDVGGSPAPGSGGTGYTLSPGTFQVAASALRGYTFAYGGSCGPDGTVTLAEGSAVACTIVASDPAPTLNKNVNGTPKSGTIKVKLPGRNAFRILREGEQLPNGTVVDTLKGKITLTTSAGGGKTSKADFYDGIFKFKQAKGLTTLTLVEQLACTTKNGKKASAAAAKKKKRRLWGDGKGRFQTKGKHSAATVVGTKWLVEDTCTTTLTRVVRGKVKVRDFVKNKTITLKKGKRYTARAKGR